MPLTPQGQTQAPIFLISPRNLTTCTCNSSTGEEQTIFNFECVADHADDIDWIVNGNLMRGKQDSLGAVIVSLLSYNATIGNEVTVMCKAWGNQRTSNTSNMATVSVRCKYFNGLQSFEAEV